MDPQAVSRLKIGDVGDWERLSGASHFHFDARPDQVKGGIVRGYGRRPQQQHHNGREKNGQHSTGCNLESHFVANPKSQESTQLPRALSRKSFTCNDHPKEYLKFYRERGAKTTLK
jgi:hypothetical protein